MDGEDEELAHEANGTIAANRCKTARHGRITSHYEFAPHSFSLTADFCRSQLCTVCTVMHSLELTNDLQIVSSFVTTPLKM